MINFSGMVYGIKSKFSAYVEGDVEENKRLYVLAAANAVTATKIIATTRAISHSNISRTAYVINLDLLGLVVVDFEQARCCSVCTIGTTNTVA